MVDEDLSTEAEPTPPTRRARRTHRHGAWRAAAGLVVAAAAIGGWSLGAPAQEQTLPGQIGRYGDALARVPEAPPPEPAWASPATPVQVGEPRIPIGQAVGSLSIPKLGVNVAILEGIDLWVIDQGSGHWPGTALPGQQGNLVIGGHRTLYQRPFHDLDKLAAGDAVLVTDREGVTHTYEVRGVVIVPENAVGIVNQNDAHTATLFACHPKGSATHRIVAKLRLLDDTGAPVDDDASLPPLELGTRPGDDVMTIEPGMARPSG